jgi:methenyltetrahydromethanopterin cyclohydrolase
MLDTAKRWPSVNRRVAPLVERLIADAELLRIDVETAPEGHCLIDAGIAVPGGLEAGLRIAEICLAGLAQVSLLPAGGQSGDWARWPWAVTVHSAHPVLACLGSQYAGWSLSHGAGKKGFLALGSGPARALAAKEPLFAELGYRDSAESTVLVLEVDKRPPPPVIEKVLRDCGVAPDGLTVILTPTSSLAGTLQVVARVLEVALHKVHELGFPLGKLIDGMGTAPLPPPAPDFLTAMGRCNDAIIYGGLVQLFVTGDDAAARDLAARLPSSASRDYGRPFAEVFAAYKGDFYAIDPMLFSPAEVIVTALDSGNSFHAGRRDAALVERSFG